MLLDDTSTRQGKQHKILDQQDHGFGKDLIVIVPKDGNATTIVSLESILVVVTLGVQASL